MLKPFCSHKSPQGRGVNCGSQFCTSTSRAGGRHFKRWVREKKKHKKKPKHRRLRTSHAARASSCPLFFHERRKRPVSSRISRSNQRPFHFSRGRDGRRADVSSSERRGRQKIAGEISLWVEWFTLWSLFSSGDFSKALLACCRKV